ncbi:metal-nicotianamine transporter YSL3-like [Canna indica]|uniref:Metal-nicotianamine transporter YSL3-like n=1 Tax=Canna indica TaxID=4628 RepID=A0AAQ3KNI2_9LILI|nr:metal-nicotianamine transporter YSL3-like [Canna indica]
MLLYYCNKAIASGLICGDRLWILLSSLLALAKVNPPVCMRFVPEREIASVAGIISPGFEGFRKLFFGQVEIAIPVYSSFEHRYKDLEEEQEETMYLSYLSDQGQWKQGKL